MKTLAAVVLMSILAVGQSTPKPMVPMPGKGHKKLAIGLVAAGAGALIAGVLVSGGPTAKKPIPVKGGPVYPK